MTPRTVLFTLPADMTVEDAAKDDRVYSHSRVPIYMDDNENIIGVIFRRELLSALVAKRTSQKLEALTKKVEWVWETNPLDRTLKKFLESRQHLFVVMDEFGALAGVITLEDILEEILGQEIVDEFDEVTDMRQLARRRREELLASNPKPPTVHKP
jgi:CBS domain containing-hemolysin-like protein